MLAICSAIRAFAPEPTAIMAMTELTPMMIPSMVNPERILLTLRDLKAIRKLARIVIIRFAPFPGKSWRWVLTVILTLDSNCIQGKGGVNIVLQKLSHAAVRKMLKSNRGGGNEEGNSEVEVFRDAILFD